ncbi:MAG: hypothetical protein PWR01_3133 [Clostridiales bacterium]|jgi:hypothetical protein|nr:hypothetical protein [Clostridiales bacterium]MDN5282060.1 hypothetical protein [Candidatus Ozemobacter sp.]
MRKSFIIIASVMILFAGSVFASNHSSALKSTSRIFGWGNQEKADKLKALYPKLRTIDENFRLAEANHNGIFNSGKDKYIAACTQIVATMKELAPMIDAGFHPELESCVIQVEQAKFIAISDSTRKAQKVLEKAEKQFIKLSRRFFK